MFYVKGNNKGPINLDKFWTEEEGFLKTQAVVIDLLTQKDLETGQRLYQLNIYTIQLNNLFTSVKLLQQLQKLKIGGTGIVWITKTKRKELDEAKGNKKGQGKKA